MTAPRKTELRLVEHVARIGEEHPPIDLGTVDFTVRNPRLLAKRFGHVLDYMARVELEVDRNVLELITMLPDPPEIDRTFYADVWQPQEIQHGLILDELQVRLGPDNAVDRPRPRLGEDQDPRRPVPPRPDPGRRADALLPDRDGDRALGGAGLQPAARRGHRPRRDGGRARRSSARSAARSPRTTRSTRCPRAALAAQLSGWQKWLVRRLRRISFAPSAPTTTSQKADFGDLIRTLGIDRTSTSFADPDLPGRARAAVGAGPRACGSPTTSPSAFREAVELARARAVTA